MSRRFSYPRPRPAEHRDEPFDPRTLRPVRTPKPQPKPQPR